MDGRGKSAIGRERPGERGTALIVALLVMVIMTLLGIPFLMMGETENRIAENERLSLQALYAAEAGAQMVERWFDRPGHADNVINPPLAAIDRGQRDIDEDGDPGTATEDADGSTEHPYYKQDDDAVFGKPFRGNLVDMLLGTEDGPDMCINAADSADAENFLRDLSNKLLGGYPSGESGRRARISHIDVYAPPYAQVSGAWKRYGVGTVKVVAGIYQSYPDGSEILLAERTVKIVLSQIKLPVPQLAAVNSCGPVSWNDDLTVHWGTMVVAVPSQAAFEPDLSLPDTDPLPVSFPRVVPPSTQVDLLWGWDDDSDWQDYYQNILEWDHYEIGDPWMRFMCSTAIKEAPFPPPVLEHPWPFTWNPSFFTELRDGDIPYRPSATSSNPPPVLADWDGTHSNFIQNLGLVGAGGIVDCPDLDYTEWKELALQGGENVHYYTYAGGGEFLENGELPARLFRDITDGQNGFFFFDTTTGTPPDGTNLTPVIEVSGGTWGMTGMLYLNAEMFSAHDVTGRTVTFRAPGEPFQDKNQDGKWDESNELWVNLDYPTTQLDGDGGRFFALNEIPAGTAIRDPRGPEIDGEALVKGLFYTNGTFASGGTGNYYGSVVAIGGIVQGPFTADTPDIYWDAGLLTNWPPSEWGLGTVAITRWETDL